MKNYIVCIKCGKILQRATLSVSQIKCYHCGTMLAICAQEDFVMVASDIIEDREEFLEQVYKLVKEYLRK